MISGAAMIPAEPPFELAIGSSEQFILLGCRTVRHNGSIDVVAAHNQVSPGPPKAAHSRCIHCGRTSREAPCPDSLDRQVILEEPAVLAHARPVCFAPGGMPSSKSMIWKSVTSLIRFNLGSRSRTPLKLTTLLAMCAWPASE
jgi:hypothetical protein